MKIKVKTDCDRCKYITPGKIYESSDVYRDKKSKYIFSLIDDEGCMIECYLKECGHLNYEDWELIEVIDE